MRNTNFFQVYVLCRRTFLERYDATSVIAVSTPARGRRLFFFHSEIFRNVSAFFEGSSCISLVIFLNFSERLLINSTNISGKNWAHQRLKNFHERFWIFLTVHFCIRSFELNFSIRLTFQANHNFLGWRMLCFYVN